MAQKGGIPKSISIPAGSMIQFQLTKDREQALVYRMSVIPDSVNRDMWTVW